MFKALATHAAELMVGAHLYDSYREMDERSKPARTDSSSRLSPFSRRLFLMRVPTRMASSSGECIREVSHRSAAKKT